MVDTTNPGCCRASALLWGSGLLALSSGSSGSKRDPGLRSCVHGGLVRGLSGHTAFSCVSERVCRTAYVASRSLTPPQRRVNKSRSRLQGPVVGRGQCYDYLQQHPSLQHSHVLVLQQSAVAHSHLQFLDSISVLVVMISPDWIRFCRRVLSTALRRRLCLANSSALSRVFLH